MYSYLGKEEITCYLVQFQLFQFIRTTEGLARSVGKINYLPMKWIMYLGKITKLLKSWGRVGMKKKTLTYLT